MPFRTATSNSEFQIKYVLAHHSALKHTSQTSDSPFFELGQRDFVVWNRFVKRNDSVWIVSNGLLVKRGYSRRMTSQDTVREPGAFSNSHSYALQNDRCRRCDRSTDQRLLCPFVVSKTLAKPRYCLINRSELRTRLEEIAFPQMSARCTCSKK